MEKIQILENTGYGIYRTDAGEYLVDYALNGADRVLQNAVNGAVEYLIVGDERNEQGKVTAFCVKAFAAQPVEAPGMPETEM